MNVLTTLPRNRIIVGDALEKLTALPDRSVDCVITSPPYFRLRDYDAHGQLGLEAHVDEWVDELARISEQIARVLVPTGTFWLNVGDSYATHPREGAARKSLLMAPERLALRLQQDGWIIRNKIVWAKPNPMPTSVLDRLNTTYEIIYVLARQSRYFLDLDAVRVPHATPKIPASTGPRRSQRHETWRGPNTDTATGLAALKANGIVGHPLGKNPGDVWTIGTGGYRSAHHAIYPVRLAERMVTAGCPEARCTRCRLPWKRRVIRGLGRVAARSALEPSCLCTTGSEPGVVLDPFMGSGTTAVAAEALGRDWLGIELNPDFAAAAQQRTHQSRSAPPRASSESAAA